MQLDEVVQASAAVAATRSRTAKVEALAGLLATADRSDPDELTAVTTWLAGALRQRRTGVGWRSLAELPDPAPEATLTVRAADEAFEEMASLSGPGSAGARSRLLADLMGAATPDEQQWLRRLAVGELRQGALDSVVQAAVAQVARVPLVEVRRAAMLAGATPPVAVAALTAPTPEAATEALAGFVLEVGRPVQPMLASSAPDVATGFVGLAGEGGPVQVDAKLDGIRIQVHRDGDEVVVATRSLDVITERLPEVVEAVRSLAAQQVVLDGEALLVTDDGRPRAFAETSSRTGTRSTDEASPRVVPFFFDLLHLDGEDLLDLPLAARTSRLADLVPREHRVDSLTTNDAAEAEEFARQVLASGHEGVVLKDPDAPYAAGRRGSAWVKVKPVHMVDLVVLAVEHGSGRRKGWLSNIHLGARGTDGDLVMVGKTFKGMTDEMLAWQTTRFRDLETSDDGWVVTVRPEQVVEIAFDGVQRSTRYPGGVALRFARVLRYRDDKTPDQADTLATLQAHLH